MRSLGTPTKPFSLSIQLGHIRAGWKDYSPTIARHPVIYINKKAQ